MTYIASKFSFSRASRLYGTHAYAAVFAFKCRVTGERFHVYARPNGGGAARLGFVVGKRIIPQAARRNYCKRLVREVFRAERHALAGIDLLVRPRSPVTRALSSVARAEIRDLFHNAQRRCRKRSEAMRPQ